ncbi:MAG: tRNA (adenosine(37)-N6)-dimethylallyltransferase MiaA [Candidatus Auribacterota bacterium]|nr:tRNA (adenosine(37)-N6)-dimethylallyltransferase MiaA [Candidatus Auribacterota bacterium]
MLDKIPIILGPTAVGKTEVSLLLAERLGGEIVSADAFQVYRGMDIGTAKPGTAELSRVSHHLIDILDLHEQYSAARFRALALSAIGNIKCKGLTPLVVGGAGMYLRALVDGLFEAPPSDQEYRDFLRGEEAEKGPGYLHNLLEKEDPESAARIHRNNIKRVIRALEVLKLTGVPISRWQRQWEGRKNERRTNLRQGYGGQASNAAELRSPSTVNRQPSTFLPRPPSIPHSPFPIPYSLIGLRRDRKDLYNRINWRVLEMFEIGLVEETRGLVKKGLMDNRVARQALGYKEVAGYLAGEYNREEAIKRLSTNTRHFAKRQLTWWRRDRRIRWVDIAAEERSGDIVNTILNIFSEGKNND